MDLEKIYRVNIEDAEKLFQIAKDSNDIELMQKATKDKQQWIDKLQALHEVKKISLS